MSDLADKLERLCCAETEKQFFDCVTDNIQQIVSALRAQPLPGLVATLRSHANDWANAELAPLLRRAADVIEGGVSPCPSTELLSPHNDRETP